MTEEERIIFEQGFEEGYAVAKRNYKHCIRCGVDKKIIKRDKYVCEYLGKAYNKHIYK